MHIKALAKGCLVRAFFRVSTTSKEAKATAAQWVPHNKAPNEELLPEPQGDEDCRRQYVG